MYCVLIRGAFGNDEEMPGQHSEETARTAPPGIWQIYIARVQRTCEL
jgi:hypothetical protein